MRDLVRKYVEAGAGMLNAERAEELANDLIEWSRKSTERVVAIVQREVRRQLRLAGAATQDELRELRKRVRSLERQIQRAEGSAKRSGSKSSSSKRSGSKSSSSKRSGSKRSTTRSSSRRSGGASGRSGGS